MSTASDLLATKKAGGLFTCRRRDTVRAAALVMSDHRIGALLVVDEGRIEGIFTERDVLMRVVAQGLDAGATRVEDAMTREVITVSAETPVEQVEEIMRSRRIRHLPVIGAGGLQGLVSVGDVLVFHAEERRHMVDQLTSYVTGR